MFTLAEICETLCKKIEDLQILDEAELTHAETVGNEHQDYLHCLELRAVWKLSPMRISL
jgi:hypothetical protein